jgi:predicted nuclease with TOPRIM domain
VSDHYHEPYEVYGLDETGGDARQALARAEGLRGDLGRVEERIAELERLVSVYGETLDRLRNRVYALETGIPDDELLS